MRQPGLKSGRAQQGKSMALFLVLVLVVQLLAQGSILRSRKPMLRLACYVFSDKGSATHPVLLTPTLHVVE